MRLPAAVPKEAMALSGLGACVRGSGISSSVTSACFPTATRFCSTAAVVAASCSSVRWMPCFAYSDSTCPRTPSGPTCTVAFIWSAILPMSAIPAFWLCQVISSSSLRLRLAWLL
ncbi:hypothetical protein D3C72_1266050 [compost metagenome]